MPPIPNKEYWDTCLFIAFVKDNDDERPAVDIVDALLRKAREERDRLIIVSTMVLAELRANPDYNPEHHRMIRDIFYTNRS